MLAPARLSDQTLDDLKATLKQHFEPTRVVVAKRFRFYRRNQAAGETIAEFVAELRRLSTHCAFGAAQLEEALRDRLVCGLRSEAIQRKLLSVPELTFADALKTAQRMEAAEMNAQQLKGPDSDSASIHRLATRRRPPVSGSQEKKSCYRCGRKNHHHSVCPFKDAKCHFCGKLGHLATVCRAKKRAEQEKKKDSKHVRKENWLWVEEADVSPVSEEETLPVFQIGSGKSTHPISVTVTVNDQPLKMELDTGAAVSIISEQEQRKLYPLTSLHPTHTLLRTYTGATMPVAGEMTAQVEYGSQRCTLPLIVVAGNGPALLG